MVEKFSECLLQLIYELLGFLKATLFALSVIYIYTLELLLSALLASTCWRIVYFRPHMVPSFYLSFWSAFFWWILFFFVTVCWCHQYFSICLLFRLLLFCTSMNKSFFIQVYFRDKFVCWCFYYFSVCLLFRLLLLFFIN